jgi:hypothetical protein
MFPGQAGEDGGAGRQEAVQLVNRNCEQQPVKLRCARTGGTPR